MYEQQEKDDLSLDFHSGRTLRMQYRTVINITALLSFLQIVFCAGAVHVRQIVAQTVSALTGNDALLLASLMDVWALFEYTCSFMLPLGVVLLIFRDSVFRPYVPFSPKIPEHPFAAIAFSLAVLQLFASFTDVLLNVLETFGVQLVFYDSVPPETPVRILLYFVSTVLLPAFVEEMIFRGYILHLLLPFGKTAAILISAILFGLSHLYLPQILYATAVGVLIGYFVVRGESLWIGIFIHALNNLISFLSEMAACFLPEPAYGIFTAVTYAAVILCGIVGALVLCAHASGSNRGTVLESGSVYGTTLEIPIAMRDACTLPMIAYLICAAYYTLIGSVRLPV